MSFLSFIVAILPIFLIGLYIYRRDKVKEPSKLLFKLFLGGIISCFPAAFIGFFLGFLFPPLEEMNFFQTLLYVFFVVATLEELFKWSILNKIAYNNKDYDSFYDMILYASFVALGFACFENILYVSESGIAIGLLRAITAVPGHVCDGIIMGYYLSLSKVNSLKNNEMLSKKYMVNSLLIPIITHGIYDFCLFWPTFLFLILFIIFIIILFIFCFRKVIYISKNNIKFKSIGFNCIRCGNIIYDNYCTHCFQKKEI